MGCRLLTQGGRQGWDQDWSPSSFSIPGAELLLLCAAQVPWLENGIAVWLQWSEPLGCFSRLPASTCPPCSTFALGMSHPWWRLWRREPSPSPCCALSLQCSSAPQLALPNYICYKLVLGASCCTGSPLCKARSKWEHLTAEECPSPLAALEGAGRSRSYTSGWSSSFWRPELLHSPAAVQGPLSALGGGSGQGAAGPHHGVVSQQPGCARELTQQVTISVFQPSCPTLPIPGCAGKRSLTQRALLVFHGAL